MISTSRILLPHDGSEMSDKALDKAIEFCKSFKSQLIILYVVDDRLIIPSDAILGFIKEKLTLENTKTQTLKILKTGAEAMLRERMKKASAHGVIVRFIIRMGSPAEGIADVAASEKVDRTSSSVYPNIYWLRKIRTSSFSRVIHITTNYG